MVVSLEFLRGVLGILGLACAYMAGRSLVAVRRGWQKMGSLYGWLIRLMVCLAAVAFRHSIDAIDWAVWAMAALAFTAGAWQAGHRKPAEDLTRQIFPD